MRFLDFSPFPITGKVSQGSEIRFADVAEPERFPDMKVTWIHVSIMLQNQIAAAVSTHGADARNSCRQTRNDGIKETDGDSMYITRVPFIENSAQKLPPFSRGECKGLPLPFRIRLHAFNVLLIAYAEFPESGTLPRDDPDSRRKPG